MSATEPVAVRGTRRYRKTERTVAHRRQAIPEPIEVSRFWKNRKGDAITVTLRDYEGHSLIDIRQFFTAADGMLRPTKKGLAVSIVKLPELAAALVKALARARELNLLPAGDA